MARRLEGKGEDNVVALQTIRSGHDYLLAWCRFHYDGWYLNSSDKTRIGKYLAAVTDTPQLTDAIESLFQELLAEGAVTNKTREDEKAWVTSDIACKIIKGALSNAMKDGTPDWDYTIMSALTVLLLSATGARAGDIAQSEFRDGNACLC